MKATSSGNTSLNAKSLPGSANPPDTGVDISSTDYARRRRELMKMMSDLKSMGAEALIDLPSVVVIGGQSAGKSSLVEAVSGINVPRDSGTCTRCPMECTMSSHATSWSCTITLRMGFDKNGRDLPVQKTTTQAFGRTITDKSEVEVWLRRAQAAVLNPNVPSSSFQTKTIEELRGLKNTLKFSRNVVCVSIEDPDATDLSFYDLPGLIQNEEAETVALLIEESLPRLREDIDKLLAQCNKEFDALPPPLANDPQIEVLGRVNAFCDVFKSFVNGSHEDKRLAQRNRALYSIFKRDIRGTAPDFRPFDTPEEYVPLDDTQGKMTLIERDPGVKVMGIYDVRKVIHEAIGWELPNNVPYQAKANLIAEFVRLWVAPSQRCLAGINDVLDQVINTLISTHFGRFKVLEGYVGIHVGVCKAHAREAVKSALALETTPHYTQNTHYLQTLREKWLAHYKTVRSRASQYKARVYHIQQHHPTTFSDNDSEKASMVEGPMECEGPMEGEGPTEYGGPMERAYPSEVRDSPRETPRARAVAYTPSFDSQPSARAQPAIWAVPEQAPVLRSATSSRVYATSETPEAKALRALAEAGYANIGISDLARLLPPDSFLEELVVMADVRAYYHVAYKASLRIIDHIPLTIEHALHHALAEQLSQSLLTSLLTDVASGPNFSERMNELVSEDASIAQKRASLSTRKQRLSDIRRRLMTFGSST
ncbi:hypothetical protein BDR03DRAFT_996026 [Suillus americanus]|nr:hypothetical protein BDR03DRAFT_996026 [Suillus americanus]